MRQRTHDDDEVTIVIAIYCIIGNKFMMMIDFTFKARHSSC